MKKLLTYSLLLMGLITALMGCKPQPSVSTTNEPNEHKSVPIESIVNDVTAEIGINNPIPIDDQALDQFILAAYTETSPPFSREDIDEYYGLMCTSNVSSDIILGIRTSSDIQTDVVDVLEAVRSTRTKCFDGYIDTEYQKANCSKVFTVGDYTFLAILGNPNNGAEENASKVDNMILSYFDEKE